MSRTLYADTGAFIALLYQRDQAHEVIAEHFRVLRAAGDRLITSEPVIAATPGRPSDQLRTRLLRCSWHVGLPNERE